VRKDTLAYGGIFLALAAFILFFQFPKTEKKEAKRKQLFEYNEDEVRKIHITSKSGEVTICQKDKEGEWLISSPQKVSADGTEIYNLMNIFTTTTISRVVNESSEDLSVFGLDKPEVHVTFDFNVRKIGLKLGAKNPDGSGVYALRDGDKSVLLLPSYVTGTLDKNFFTMRDKHVFRSFLINPPAALDWQSDGVPLSLKREKEGWKLSVDTKVNTENVKTFLNNLQFLTIKVFVDKNKLSESLFSNSREKLVLTGEDGKREVLIIGKKKLGTSLFYGKNESKKQIFLISEDDKKAIFPTLDYLKYKEVSDGT